MRSALPKPRHQPKREQPDHAPLRPSQKAVMPGDRMVGQRELVIVALAIGAVLLYRALPNIRAVTETARQTLLNYEQLPERTAQALQGVIAEFQSKPGQTERSANAELARQRHQETNSPSKSSASGALDHLKEAASSLVQGPLSKVANLSSEGMEVALGPAGQVLMTSKYSVQRLGAGNPNDRHVLFNPSIYRAQFPDTKPQAMASALALPNERYLLGGWHGEVLLWSAGRLQQLSQRDERPKGRITDIRLWGNEILVAGDGLWRVAADERSLEELSFQDARRIRAMGQRSGRLLLATEGRRIYEWKTGRSALWLTLPSDGGRIEMITPADDGGWWIGSTRGLFHASDDGQQLTALLTGVWVKAVIERRDELWVGSWKHGLLLWRDSHWYRMGSGIGGLDSDAVSSLVIDSKDHLWLALYGGGGWQAELEPLRNELMQRPWLPEELQPESD